MEKPRSFVCSVCKRAFGRMEHMRRHERSHTKEKPFVCEGDLSDGQQGCGRSFSRRDLLIRHQKKLHFDPSPSRRRRAARKDTEDPVKAYGVRRKAGPRSTRAGFGRVMQPKEEEDDDDDDDDESDEDKEADQQAQDGYRTLLSQLNPMYGEQVSAYAAAAAAAATTTGGGDCAVADSPMSSVDDFQPPDTVDPSALMLKDPRGICHSRSVSMPTSSRPIMFSSWMQPSGEHPLFDARISMLEGGQQPDLADSPMTSAASTTSELDVAAAAAAAAAGYPESIPTNRYMGDHTALRDSTSSGVESAHDDYKDDIFRGVHPSVLALSTSTPQYSRPNLHAMYSHRPSFAASGPLDRSSLFRDTVGTGSARPAATPYNANGNSAMSLVFARYFPQLAGEARPDASLPYLQTPRLDHNSLKLALEQISRQQQAQTPTTKYQAINTSDVVMGDHGPMLRSQMGADTMNDEMVNFAFTT